MEEFGSPEEALAAFARVNPARRAARRLLGLGPVVGGCWVTALAMAGSMVRVAVCARALGPMLRPAMAR